MVRANINLLGQHLAPGKYYRRMGFFMLCQPHAPAIVHPQCSLGGLINRQLIRIAPGISINRQPASGRYAGSLPI